LSTKTSAALRNAPRSGQIRRIGADYSTFEGGDAEIIDYTSGTSVKLDPSLYDVRAGLAYQF